MVCFLYHVEHKKNALAPLAANEGPDHTAHFTQSDQSPRCQLTELMAVRVSAVSQSTCTTATLTEGIKALTSLVDRLSLSVGLENGLER